MALKLSKGFVIGAAASILVAGGTGVGQYYLWDKKMDATVAEYEDQMFLLNQTLEAIGELTDAYTVLVEGETGQVITQENLVLIQVPASTIGESYILDPSTVVGQYYKVDIQPGTPLTQDLVMATEIDDTSRESDIVANIWPVGLKSGDYIDVEIIYPTGEIFTVLSKKRVNSITGETVKVVSNRNERYLYDSALVDYYLSISDGTQVRFSKYTDPGIQEAAVVYYSVPSNVSNVMSIDPNIVERANEAIQSARRTIISATLDAIERNKLLEEPKDYATGITGVQAKLQEAYQAYLETQGLDMTEGDLSNPVYSPSQTPVEGVIDNQVQENIESEEGSEQGVVE